MQGWEAKTSHVGNASTPCQPPAETHRVALPDSGCSAPLLLAGSTISLAEMAVDSLGSTVEPACALPGGHGSAGGSGSMGSEAGSVCVSVCMCVCKQWPCHAVPLHARLCQDRAEQGQFLLVLGRNRPPCSSVTQLQLLCCGCPAQPCPVLEDREGHQGTSRTLILSRLDSGTDPLAAVPAKLRGWHPHGSGGPLAPCSSVQGGLQLGFLQSKQQSRWHSRLAVSQLLMTLPAINKGVANAGRSPCLWYLSPWWSSAPKSQGH